MFPVRPSTRKPPERLHASPDPAAAAGLRLDLRGCRPHHRWTYFFDGPENTVVADAARRYVLQRAAPNTAP